MSKEGKRKRYHDIVDGFMPKLQSLMHEYDVKISCHVDSLGKELKPEDPGVEISVVFREEEVVYSVPWMAEEKWHSRVIKPSSIREETQEFADKLWDELNEEQGNERS